MNLFEEDRLMITVETGHYVKGMHNLLNAMFDLRYFSKFELILHKFEEFAKTDIANQYDNFRVHTSIYINSAKINQHLMKGTFAEGVKMIPNLIEELKEYALFVDRHRIVVFNYKIASLYFGNQEYDKAIDYLNLIIDSNADLRYDLQCYARLLHLMSHYELGNDALIESLTKSVYRFMAKMKNLTVVEEAIFKFLRDTFNVSSKKLKPEFEKLLNKIKYLEKNRFETRAFAYLDIISWVEGKVFEKPMATIIYEKYKASKARNY
jgi:tetratricopeptide (TPR) repeat protein